MVNMKGCNHYSTKYTTIVKILYMLYHSKKVLVEIDYYAQTQILKLRRNILISRHQYIIQ